MREGRYSCLRSIAYLRGRLLRLCPVGAALTFFLLANFASAQLSTIVDSTGSGAIRDGNLNPWEYGNQTQFSGGFNSGFGNIIGAGSRLYFASNSAGKLNLAIQYGGGFPARFQDVIVVYIDSVAGGLGGIYSINDVGNGADHGRAGISGIGLQGGASKLTFPSGFFADYAIAIEPYFAGLFRINSDGSLTFLRDLQFTPASSQTAPSDPSDSIQFHEMELLLSDIGLSAGGTFKFIATLLNANNGYRSNEFHGQQYGGGNIGTNPFTLTSFNVFRSYSISGSSTAPQITGVSPNPVAGTALPGRVPITLSGNNFAAGLSVTLTWSTGTAQLDSSNITVLGPAQIRMNVATDITPDHWTVQITNPDGKSSNVVGFDVVAPASSPAPTISNVTPNSVTGVPLPGRTDLTISGANFQNGAVIQVGWSTGSKTLSSSYATVNSPTQVSISVATDVTADTWTVQVINPDGQASNIGNFSVTAPTGVPAPVISSITPSSIQGVPLPNRVTFTLVGSGFGSDSTVKVAWSNGSKLLEQINVTVVSSARIDISVATDVTPDLWTAQVINSDGQSSNLIPFQVLAPASAPAPHINSMSPTTVTGRPLPERVPLTIYGTNFAAPVGVNLAWTGGSATLDPSYVQLVDAQTINITVATDITADSWNVQVANPDGQNSNSAEFQVYPPGSAGATVVIAPIGTTSFGSVALGSYSERNFSVKNTGSSVASVTASTASPFTIVQGSQFTLAGGQSAQITVRFTPTAPHTYATNLVLGGAAGQTRPLAGSGYSTTAQANTGNVAGRITDAVTSAPVTGAVVSVNGPGANVFTGGAMSTVTDANGSFQIAGVPPGNIYQILASVTNQRYYTADIPNVQVTAGVTTTQNIALQPVVSNAPPNLDESQIPVVLVRGWGDQQSWDQGEKDYWGSFRSSSDFQYFKYIWDCNQPDADLSILDPVIDAENSSVDQNARSLRNYLIAKLVQYRRTNTYYPPRINIVAHSMGGLIVRRFLENSSVLNFTDLDTGQPVAVAVGAVVMLCTPNAGTFAADFIKDILPFYYRSQWTSTMNLTTTYVRDQFNPQWRWPAQTKLFLYAATGGLTGQFYNETDGFELAFASGFLKTTNSSFGLASELEDDGVVTTPSVAGIFYVPLPLGVPGLDVPVQSFSDPAATYVNDTDVSAHAHNHNGVLQDSATVSWVKSSLLGEVQPSKSSSASSSETSGVPRQVQLESTTDNLVAGNTTSVSFFIDAESSAFIQFTSSSDQVGLRLTDPNGMTVDGNSVGAQFSSETNAGFSITSIQLTSPTHGQWHLLIDGTNLNNDAMYQVKVTNDSTFLLIPGNVAPLRQGQTAVMSCALANATTNAAAAIQNGSLTAEVAEPDGSTVIINLFDDGLHNDGSAADGTSANSFIPSAPGVYSVTYRATFQHENADFAQRTAFQTFLVGPPDAALNGDPMYQTIDTNNDGLADVLQTSMWCTVAVPGTYAIAGELVDTTGNRRFPASGQFISDTGGSFLVSLSFDLNSIRSVSGIGIYHIENLKLLEVSPTSAQVDAYSGGSSFLVGPTIASQPADQTANEGTSAVFTVVSSDATAYQWAFEGVDIPGATSTSLTLQSVRLDQAGHYSVRLANATGVLTSYNASLTVTPAVRFVDWEAAHFTADQIQDPTVSGPTADPDGDGIPNLLEYAFNGNPFSRDGSIQPVAAVVNDSGLRYFTFTYRQRVSAADLLYTVEVSDDLASWDDSGSQLDQVGNVPSGDGVTNLVTVRLKLPMTSVSRKFLRLQVAPQ